MILKIEFRLQSKEPIGRSEQFYKVGKLNNEHFEITVLKFDVQKKFYT